MKRLIVTIVFLVPISILLFLQFFGQSQFRIPLFYPDGVVVAECGLSSVDTYTVEWLGPHNKSNHITISKLGPIKNFEEMDRVISSQAGKTNTQILVITNEGEPNPVNSLIMVSVNSEDLKNIGDCQFLVGQQIGYEPDCFILTDSKNRIRGYYQTGDLEEIDRLLAEIDILRLEKEDD